MQFVQSWWNWCTESFGHMFAGVTAPILLISAFAILFVASSGGDDGGIPRPPRSDVAGVCLNTTPTSSGSTDCGTTTAQSAQTPTPVPPTPTPKPRTYTVRSGDTLYAICAAQAPDMSPDDCLAAIVDLSDLDGPDELAEGQVLTLPPANATSRSTATSRATATATPVSAAPTPAVVESEPEPEPSEEPTPAPQASLIAVGPQHVEDAPGTPPEDDEDGDVSPQPTPTAEELAAREGIEYTVEDGDSLLGICVSQVPDMPEGDCMDFVVLLNGLEGPDEIRSGQVLFLP